MFALKDSTVEVLNEETVDKDASSQVYANSEHFPPPPPETLEMSEYKNHTEIQQQATRPRHTTSLVGYYWTAGCL